MRDRVGVGVTTGRTIVVFLVDLSSSSNILTSSFWLYCYIKVTKQLMVCFEGCQEYMLLTD